MSSLGKWGTVGHLTEDQAKALSEFSETVSASDLEVSRYSAETREQVSCRFLRARKFDVSAAVTLCREAAQVLLDNNAKECAEMSPEQCLECDEQVMKTFYPHGQQGFDRLGRLICYEHNGNAQVNALIKTTTLNRMVKYHFWTMENVFEEYFKRSPRDPSGQHIVSTFVISDLENLGLSALLIPATFDQIKRLIKIDNVCYPEMLGKMVLINAPGFAVSFFNMVKGWLDPRTQSKIEMLGSGPEMKKRLLEMISPENLPKMYGGLAPNPFYVKPNTEYVAVPRSGELKRTITVPPGMTLQVDNYISEGPIDLNIFCTTADSPNPVLVETRIGMVSVVDGEPERFLVTIAQSELTSGKEHTFSVVWSNANVWGQKMIVYSLTAVTPTVATRKLDVPSPQHDVPEYKVTVQGRIVEPGSPGLLGFFGF